MPGDAFAVCAVPPFPRFTAASCRAEDLCVCFSRLSGSFSASWAYFRCVPANVLPNDGETMANIYTTEIYVTRSPLKMPIL
jgi:hypothetical protein